MAISSGREISHVRLGLGCVPNLMLFGSAVVVAILLAGSTESTSPPSPLSSHRSQTHLWLQSEARPRQLDLTPKPPLELKSGKICGANGVAAFIPIAARLAVGAAFSTYRPSYTERVAQYVVAIRFRF